MLYDIGYKTELAPNTEERSEPFTIFVEGGLSTISVNGGASLIVNGANMGSSTNVVDGATVEILGTSGSTQGVPRFFQFYQDGEQEGTFVLINSFEFRFEYNDELNGKYAWEVLDDSVWVPSDNGSIGVLSEDVIAYTYLGDKEIDFSSSATLRNKVHVLDYYLNVINVLDYQGNYIGRVSDLAYEGPVDICTVYKSGSESRMLLAVAFELSNRVAFYSNTYVELGGVDVAEPVAVASVLNTLYIAQRNTNNITVVVMNDDGTINSTSTVVLARKPHRLYQIGEYCAVLTETSIEFILGDTFNSTFSLPQFASALVFDVLSNRVYVTHRHERKVTKITLDFDNGHVIDDTVLLANQGYLDSIVYNFATDTIYVSDIVEKEILIFDQNLNLQDKIELEDRHSYEMFINQTGTRLILSCLYPDIDARLVISNGDPDPIVYSDIDDIALGATGYSPFYMLDGTMEPVTLYLFPDDSDVEVGVNVGGTTYTYGTTISPGETFNFEVTLPKGSARRIEFVLGLHVYSFTALPDSKRLIPADLIFEPISYAELDAAYQSNTITIFGLDVEPCAMEITSGTASIVKNGTNVGSSTTIINGDEVYILMSSSPVESETVYSTVRYADLFDTTWAITSRKLEESYLVDRPIVSGDFIDVLYAELAEEYISESITINLIALEDSIEINGDYGASLIVDGVDVGTTFPVTTTGEISVQIKLTTEPVFDTDHQITLSLDKLSITWVVTTMPVETVIPMEFGSISGVTLGDRLLSNEVVLDSVGSEYTVSVFVPRNTRLLVDGYPASVDTDYLNYRDVLRRDTIVRVPGGSTLQLEGYALGLYGTVTAHRVRAGLSQGIWHIQSISLSDALPSREIIPYGFERTSITVEDKAITTNINPTYAYLESTVYKVDLERTANYADQNIIIVQGREAVDVKMASTYYGLKGNNVYSKPARPILSAEGNPIDRHTPHGPKLSELRTYRKKLRTNVIINGANVFVRSHPGLTVTAPEVQFQRDDSGPVSYSVEPLYARSDNTTWVTLDEKSYIRHTHNSLFTELGSWTKWTLPDNIQLFKTWQKDATVKIVLFTGEVVKYGGYTLLTDDPEYGKFEILNHTHEEEYTKDGTPSPHMYSIDYLKPILSDIAGLNIPYEKSSFTNRVNGDFEWITHHRSIHTTPIWLSVDITTNDYAAANVLVTDITSNVDVPLLDYPSYSFGYNLRVDVHTSPVEITSEYVVEKDNYAHAEASIVLPAFISVDSFTFNIGGSPAVIVGEDDCMNLGNESCLQEGMFATEQEAFNDAVNNWGVDSIAVRTNELSEGCWVWSQVLPCVNSCYGCPDKGYLFGG